MKAFVAGATGYTGREVVRELRERGVETTAHVRPDSSSLQSWQQRFRKLGAEVDTTRWDPAAIAATLRALQPDFVFALLGTTRARAKLENASYETVDYGLTAMLLHATSHAKFIYLSSIGVNARSRNPYLAVRWRVESELRASGLSYIIARPAFITGADREEFRFTERAGAVVTNSMLDLAALIGLGALRERFASLSGRQLGRALVNAALDDSFSNVVLEAKDLRNLARR